MMTLTPTPTLAVCATHWWAEVTSILPASSPCSSSVASGEFLVTRNALLISLGSCEAEAERPVTEHVLRVLGKWGYGPSELMWLKWKLIVLRSGDI